MRVLNGEYLNRLRIPDILLMSVSLEELQEILNDISWKSANRNVKKSKHTTKVTSKCNVIKNIKIDIELEEIQTSICRIFRKTTEMK